MAKTTNEQLTAVNLKDALWTTLQGLQNDSVEPGKGDAIAVQAREILRTIKTQLMVQSACGRKIPTEVIVFSEGV